VVYVVFIVVKPLNVLNNETGLRQIIKTIKENTKELVWMKELRIVEDVPKKYASLNSVSMEPSVLASVGHIIGVSSCKGSQ
jgi:uncharacterized protein YoxC